MKTVKEMRIGDRLMTEKYGEVELRQRKKKFDKMGVALCRHTNPNRMFGGMVYVELNTPIL